MSKAKENKTSATVRRFKPYPAYKDSGVEWLGKVPAEWDMQKLKYVGAVNFSSVDKHSLEDEQPVLLCNYTDVYYNDYITPDKDYMKATATPSEIQRFALKKDDVLVTKDSEEWSDIAVSAYVASDMDGVLCGYHLAHIRPRDGIFGKYLFRAFSARGINDQFRVEATGITRYGLGKYGLDNALFPVPPVETQHIIAAFLDRETARIDKLITKKERQIELLQEKRSAFISHAVTKGLNPKARMKDSGIEWLGEIPEHWQVKRLKYLTHQLTVGIVVTPAKYYVDEGVPCLRSLNVREDRLLDNDLVYISPESNELHVKSRLHKDDLVAVRTGQPGTTAVIDSRYDGTNCIDLIIVRRSSMYDSRYLCYVMNSSFAKSQFLAGATGAIQSHFNIETASNLLIPAPPVDEQEQMRKELDAAVSHILTLMDKITSSINKLREYRTALISAAVTGKIDVYEEVA